MHCIRFEAKRESPGQLKGYLEVEGAKVRMEGARCGVLDPRCFAGRHWQRRSTADDIDIHSRAGAQTLGFTYNTLPHKQHHEFDRILRLRV